jgi:hypothetical protein
MPALRMPAPMDFEHFAWSGGGDAGDAEVAAESGPGNPGRAGGQDEDELPISQAEQERSDDLPRGQPALAGSLGQRAHIGGVHMQAVGNAERLQSLCDRG